MTAHPKDGGLNVGVSGLLSHWASEFQDSAENSRSAMDRHAHSMHADQFRAAQQQVDKDSDEIDRLRAALWQCFTDAGGDTDGKTDAAGISTDDLISTTTDCVKDLRLGYDEMLDESSEDDRLRARVAKLESARGEPVAWMNPYGGTLQVRITGLEYEKYTIPLYTAPPAQAVDVDAISDEAIEQGCEAMWAHSYRIADPGSMRAALRAIFNKGE